MKRVSLRNRILIYFLIVPFCTFIFAGIFTTIDMYDLQKFAAKTGTRVANEAARTSIVSLNQEVHAELNMLAEGQARICQLQMRRAVHGMRDFVELYRSICAGEYVVQDEGFLEAKRSIADEFTYVNFPADMSKEEVIKGLRKLTMMRNAFKYSCAYNDYYSGIGIALPNGLFFKYDWFPVPLDYDVRSTSWFNSAIKARGKLSWMDPAKSTSSNKFLMTFAQAVVYKGKVEAVIVIDVLPQTISNEFVITRGTGAYAFLISPAGNIVAKEDTVTKKLIWDITPEERKDFQETFLPHIVTGEKTHFKTTYNGEEVEAAYCPMTPGKWGIGVAISLKNVQSITGEAAKEIRNKKELFIFSSKEYITDRILIYLGIGFVLSILMLVFAAWIARRIGHPIAQLKTKAELIGKRRLNEQVEIKSNDEFQDLGEAFNAMALELDEQIKTLKDNIAKQERIKHEMNVASEIQQSMLPKVSLAFADHDEFDIYAEMHPAKEVGGDFYDFFFVDENNLFFAIGDISGKGLSAALFMMRALTLLRHEAEDGFLPDEIFVNVGNELEHNNDSCMFFTGTCGLFNVSTGEIILSNAGHPPPYLRHSSKFDEVEMDSGMIVGALPLKIEQFSTTKLQLNKGDTLFLYTDGVTEAFNTQMEEYQSRRLHETLQKLSGANPREILDRVMKSVVDFTQGAPQSDDITMMTIKYYG
jgi:sigma-B regulation protein RsbU (phosphoserine phosphatase)